MGPSLTNWLKACKGHADSILMLGRNALFLTRYRPAARRRKPRVADHLPEPDMLAADSRKRAAVQKSKLTEFASGTRPVRQHRFVTERIGSIPAFRLLVRHCQVVVEIRDRSRDLLRVVDHPEEDCDCADLSAYQSDDPRSAGADGS